MVLSCGRKQRSKYMTPPDRITRNFVCGSRVTEQHQFTTLKKPYNMKTLLTLALFICLLSSCEQETPATPEQPRPFVDNSSGSPDSLHLHIVSDIPGITIIIAGTEASTYLPPDDPDCGQYIYTSHWYYDNTIRRNFTPAYVRIIIDDISYPVITL